jgi:hypothetical protein
VSPLVAELAVVTLGVAAETHAADGDDASHGSSVSHRNTGSVVFVVVFAVMPSINSTEIVLKKEFMAYHFPLEYLL